MTFRAPQSTLPHHLRRFVALLALLPPVAALGKPTPPPDHWVSTWATAVVANDGSNPYGTPLPGPTLAQIGVADTTYREIIHTTLAGPLVRVTLTNEFGTEPLTIGAVHLALAEPGGAIQLASANRMTFNGRESIIIPPGAVAVSDPAALAVPWGVDLAVSLFVPAQRIARPTFHRTAFTTNYTAPGNVVGLRTLPPAPENTPALSSWYFLKSVDVKTVYTASAIVALGASITDGVGSTPDAHDRWPDLLAARLRGRKKTQDLAVLNEGIGGNRLLHDGVGLSALARLDQVLALPGIRYLILFEGINDIGQATGPGAKVNDVTADDLIQAYVQLINRAHAHGIKVIGATLTPYAGAGYFSDAGEAERKQMNGFIRSYKQLDGVIDFDSAVRDPQNPDRFRENLQRGDWLHPNPAGYKAMADAIDLKLFELNQQEKYDIKHTP